MIDFDFKGKGQKPALESLPGWLSLRIGAGGAQKDLIIRSFNIRYGMKLAQIRVFCVLLLELWACPERRAYLASILAYRYGKIT